MARFTKDGSREVPELNTMSLPDLIFAFLFFIMMVTSIREVTMMVQVQLPAATELTKMEKKSLATYIYMGEPLKQYQAKYGVEAAIQLNDKFATTNDIFDYIAQEKSSMSEADAQYMTTILKIDKDAKMGLITEVKQKLREADARKIFYSARRAQK
ncbi:biopolymer transporter ExbD [Porphyromonadaceae bacterium W3.11]|nr:biopolymer transporter ExbD [Porphyromonadaceae bacterium W3.11]